MRSKALPGWAHTLCTAAAALVFLLAYELVVYRVPVTEIFLPVSCLERRGHLQQAAGRRRAVRRTAGVLRLQ